MNLHRFLNLRLCQATVNATWILASITSILEADVTLFENGHSQYQIVTAAKPLPSERFAAEELQRYLERVTGDRFPIVTDHNQRTAHEIVIGTAVLPDDVAKPSAADRPGQDGFSMRTAGSRLIIDGNGPRGLFTASMRFSKTSWVSVGLRRTSNPCRDWIAW